MTDRPRPVHRHVWDDRPLPAWLDGHHHWHDGQLVIHTPDGHAQPRAGWWLIGWSNGQVTVATPGIAEREYGPDGAWRQLEQTEAALARVTGLHEQWVKAGPPPLGTLTARWWDRKLAELHQAIQPAAEQSARTTPNNPPTSKETP